MTAEERRELIMRPFPVVTRFTTSARWGGTAVTDTFYGTRGRAERGGASDDGAVAGPSWQPRVQAIAMDIGEESDRRRRRLLLSDLSNADIADQLSVTVRRVQQLRKALRGEIGAATMG